MREPTDADTDAEAWILTTEEGRALLAEVSAAPDPRPADVGRWRKTHAAPLVAAALRIAGTRARAGAKFARADGMWLDRVGLEQATAEPVARHKARRFAGGHVIDLCSGIGGDTLALAAVADVWAVDADQGMCRRTRWNAAAYDVGGRVEVLRARAERFALPTRSLVHVDPDRRASSSGRARNLAGYVPGPEFLRSLLARRAGGAIKLGPASDFSDQFGGPDCELELISLSGECKEATVWFGTLAGCRRRATCLPSGATWTDRDGPAEPRMPIAAPSRWVYDPDPSLGRAGLLDSFAAAHGLARCVPGIDFLTAPELLNTEWLAAFEVEEVHPLDTKSLRRLVARRGLGPLEIKTKGLDISVESVRKALRPPGPQPATLLLMAGEGLSRAVIARRVKPT